MQVNMQITVNFPVRLCFLVLFCFVFNSRLTWKQPLLVYEVETFLLLIMMKIELKIPAEVFKLKLHFYSDFVQSTGTGGSFHKGLLGKRHHSQQLCFSFSFFFAQIHFLRFLSVPIYSYPISNHFYLNVVGGFV